MHLIKVDYARSTIVAHTVRTRPSRDSFYRYMYSLAFDIDAMYGTFVYLDDIYNFVKHNSELQRLLVVENESKMIALNTSLINPQPVTLVSVRMMERTLLPYL